VTDGIWNARHARATSPRSPRCKGRSAHHSGCSLRRRVTGKLSTFAQCGRLFTPISTRQRYRRTGSRCADRGTAKRSSPLADSAIKAEFDAGNDADMRVGAAAGPVGAHLSARLRMARGRTHAPQYVIERLARSAALTRYMSPVWVSTDVGRAVHLVRKAIQLDQSGGLGTMGYRPAAEGAKMGAVQTPRCGGGRRWLLPDDQSGNWPLRAGRHSIKVAIINNGNLGMVRQWRPFFTTSAIESRLGQSPTSPAWCRPGFRGSGEALGCAGCAARRVTM